jgi:hypothetical protein
MQNTKKSFFDNFERNSFYQGFINRFYTAKSIYNKFKWIFGAYFLFIILGLISFFFKDELICNLDKKFGPSNGISFYLSWTASLFEDLLFFGISFIGLIVSNTLPKDEDFNTRIYSLANASSVRQKSKEYLKSEIEKLLVYNDESQVNIVITNVSGNLIEVFIEMKNTITNMCSDVAYKFNTEAFVNPTDNLNGDYGYVSYLGIFEKKKENSDNKSNILVNGEIVKLDSKGYSRSTPFEIPKDSSAEWRFCYSIWQEIGGSESNDDDWYYFKAKRFTEFFNMSITNKTNQNIYFKYRNRKPNENSNNFELVLEERCLNGSQGNENYHTIELVNNEQVQPNEKFELFFTINNINHENNN